MRKRFHPINAHRSHGEFRIYELSIPLSVLSDKEGERPYGCHVMIRSTDSSIIEGLKSLSDLDRKNFAASFLTIEHPGERPMLHIVEGSVILEMECPWNEDRPRFFLVTMAVVDRYPNNIPDHVDIQIEPDLPMRSR